MLKLISDAYRAGYHDGYGEFDQCFRDLGDRTPYPDFPDIECPDNKFLKPAYLFGFFIGLSVRAHDGENVSLLDNIGTEPKD